MGLNPSRGLTYEARSTATRRPGETTPAALHAGQARAATASPQPIHNAAGLHPQAPRHGRLGPRKRGLQQDPATDSVHETLEIRAHRLPRPGIPAHAEQLTFSNRMEEKNAPIPRAP